MENFEIIASDFDDLNIPTGSSEQYYNPYDCPMTRAIKRINPDLVVMHGGPIYLNGTRLADILPFGDPFTAVETVRQSLLAGEQAFIETTPFTI